MKLYIIHNNDVVFDQTTNPMTAAMMLLEAGEGFRIYTQLI